MTDDAATVVRLRVHQFARLEGVSVRTVWWWIAIGRVRAEKDPGGHRWWVVIKNTPANTCKQVQEPANNTLCDP
ncbi:MAG: hypothetical protein WC718_16055 [Phycisphaerales bacterium]